MTDDVDPDFDYVPWDLRLLLGLAQQRDGGQVTVVCEDGVGPALLVLVPGLFAHNLYADD